jgi:peptide alpha-N-acetyltransferase
MSESSSTTTTLTETTTPTDQQQQLPNTNTTTEIFTQPIPLPLIDGVTFHEFNESNDGSQSLLENIIKLVEKDLSEPYSCFTYRYFVHGYPKLTIVATSNEDGKLLGVIVGKADRDNKRKRLRGYIAMLAVEESWRKRGIGRALALREIETMRQIQCDEVVLETELSNTTALAFYTKLGFTKTKRLSKYYLNGGDAFRLKVWFTLPSWAIDSNNNNINNNFDGAATIMDAQSTTTNNNLTTNEEVNSLDKSTPETSATNNNNNTVDQKQSSTTNQKSNPSNKSNNGSKNKKTGKKG